MALQFDSKAFLWRCVLAGTFLYIANSAANRDSRKFENPAEFHIVRVIFYIE
jgi:hypothetical protein